MPFVILVPWLLQEALIMPNSFKWLMSTYISPCAGGIWVISSKTSLYKALPFTLKHYWNFSAWARSQQLKMARDRILKPWYQSKTLTILVVLWALFTACLGIMIVVIFVQPHWITGTIQGSKNVNFGLYRNCSDNLDDCSGSLNNFNSIYSDAWKACTVFVAFSFISTFLSVAVMLLYWLCCFESSGFGFRISSGMQFCAGMYTGL